MWRKRDTAVERFMGKVEKVESGRWAGCWRWTLKGRTGRRRCYGLHVYRKERAPAHVWSHRLFIGPIPEGYEVDHTCKNTLCVNPDHLEAVPPEVNFLRSNAPGVSFAKYGVCKRGHDVTKTENVRVYTRAGKQRQERQCKICYDARSHGWGKGRRDAA